jgi:hypothetical protein
LAYDLPHPLIVILAKIRLRTSAAEKEVTGKRRKMARRLSDRMSRKIQFDPKCARR